MTAPFAARGPAQRAAQQRERILAAARRCFVRRGFHAATMADIAETAAMSAGLIYRYFPSKAAIVQSIVDRQIEQAQQILDHLGSADDLVTVILEVFERWSRGDDEEMNAALFLEMLAVSTRDPELAAAMQRGDREIHARLQEMLRRSAGATAGERDAAPWAQRATMLQCLLEGLMVRALRQPALDRHLLREGVERALGAVREWTPAKALRSG